jgi:folylpolyglutamate synthase/dihydropteroate synthase
VLAEQGVESDSVSCYQTMQDALEASCKKALDDQQVVVAGSFVTVTQALALT